MHGLIPEYMEKLHKERVESILLVGISYDTVHKDTCAGWKK